MSSTLHRCCIQLLISKWFMAYKLFLIWFIILISECEFHSLLFNDQFGIFILLNSVAPLSLPWLIWFITSKNKYTDVIIHVNFCYQYKSVLKIFTLNITTWCLKTLLISSLGLKQVYRILLRLICELLLLLEVLNKQIENESFYWYTSSGVLNLCWQNIKIGDINGLVYGLKLII